MTDKERRILQQFGRYVVDYVISFPLCSASKIGFYRQDCLIKELVTCTDGTPTWMSSELTLITNFPQPTISDLGSRLKCSTQ